MSCPTNETYFVPVLYLYLENLIHYPDFMNITMKKTCFSYKQSIGNPLCYAISRLRAHLPKLLIYLTSFLTFIAATLPPQYCLQRSNPLTGILSTLCRFLNAAGMVSTPFLKRAYSLKFSVLKNLCCSAW